MSAVIDPATIQGTPEWHAHRRLYRNASEAGAVMGVSPWMTARQLAEIKLGLREPEPENPAMRYGHEMEPKARAWAEAQFGEVFEPQVLTRGPYSASLDGLTFDQETLLEVKCPVSGQNSETWKAAAKGEVPEHYRWQIVHQLFVSAAARALFVVFDGETGISVEVHRDAEEEDRLRKAWDEFDAYVSRGELPPPTERDVEERSDAEWLAAVSEWKRRKADLEAAKEAEQAARQTLIELAGERSVMGGGVKLTRFYRAGSIDYRKAIPEGADLEQYRKPGSWTHKITEID